MLSVRYLEDGRRWHSVRRQQLQRRVKKKKWSKISIRTNQSSGNEEEIVLKVAFGEGVGGQEFSASFIQDLFSSSLMKYPLKWLSAGVRPAGLKPVEDAHTHTGNFAPIPLDWKLVYQKGKPETRWSNVRKSPHFAGCFVKRCAVFLFALFQFKTWKNSIFREFGSGT